MDLNFASDNVEGASPPVLEAMLRANAGPAAPYGQDRWTESVEHRFAELFEHEVAVFLVATGTAANALSLSALVDPFGACLCHVEAHVVDDECGAPGFFTHGATLIGIPGIGGRIDSTGLTATLDRLPAAVKQMPAQAVTISQATECGLVYTADAIAALAATARARGLRVHMDGARFANALVALDRSPADLTWRAGVDILSFGGTKNGCLAAEAIIVFDRALAATLAYRRKRAGQTLSKGRLLSSQFEGYLADDHWLANARHANRMAARLSAGLAAIAGIRIAWPTEANEVFAILPDAVDRALKAAGATYYPWSTVSLAPDERIGESEALVRLVTSFVTEAEAVDRLVAAAGRPDEL